MGGAYSTGVLICYFCQEGGHLFGGGCLLERGRLFKEIQYIFFCIGSVHHSWW